ncbi:MAG TPA: sugar ABC transporter ATP-binding protein [Anaerolineae bacterium]|nr:sugar ABC transporter ATP-binding protein [Anaerolineae bacterium]HMR63847.1 sugar ABC transporter ATP-binding protein [Anaerolineae bacterium]
MPDSNSTILTMQNISKTFPGVQALANVDFSLRKNEIHALMGENGAGKSTLIKVLTGVERQDSGTILLEGKEILAKSPLHAQALGISPVYQEINLCPNLSVAENILLGREPKILGSINWKQLNQRARQILEQLDIYIDVTQSLDMYPVALQQMVAIARALEISAKILILDEPTSSLDSRETTKLFSVMRKLRDDGLGIIFITHFLDQMYDIADSVTILRNGRLVGTYKTAELPKMALVSKMIGRSLDELEDMSRFKRKTSERIAKEPLLKATGLGRSGSVQPLDLELYAGEVLGFAGLLGSGRTETANLLFGIDKPDHGSVTFSGQELKQFSPMNAIEHGMAFCPENRKADGIVDDLTVRENIVLALQASRGWFKFLSRKKQDEIATKYIKLLNIATPNADQLVKNLSGGNQQKVILARWLATNPHLLILDEPTRGIDVGAKAEIQKLVLELAEEGKACIFISSELEEVMRTSHRIVVMRDREKVAELAGDKTAEKEIMQIIAGS